MIHGLPENVGEAIDRLRLATQGQRIAPVAFDTHACAMPVERQGLTYQCSKPKVSGPGGLYCEKHAEIIAKQMRLAEAWKDNV